MIAPPTPPNEVQRLADLHRLRILDTPPEERFDRITRLAAHVLHVPIAVVSLVDAERQWFKSRVGLNATETRRNISFCGHAILGRDTFVVADALADERFVDNPLVTGDPAIRFYAGHPLTGLGGTTVGAFCIIDRQPRQLSDAERQVLEDLAVIVERELAFVEMAELQEKLLAAKELAERATVAKTEFLRDMSHEIRTPMNSILGVADLLAETPLNPDQQHYVSVFSRAGESLLVLVNDLLDLARIEAGRIELEEIVFDLAELLDKTRELVVPLAGEKNLQLAFDLGPEVGVRFVGDPHRLRQVLINLLGNALKFTDRGTITLRVRREPDGDDRIRFSVSDTGPGIPPEQLAKIFEAFNQADSSVTRRYGGSGLGLSISHGLAAIMGGYLRVESEVGHGSVFHLIARLRSCESSPTPPSPAREREEAWPSTPLKILLVDDSEESRLLIKLYLKSIPHVVDVAENGATALEKCRSGRFDLVLMDMQMPVMDGYSATHAIREWEAAQGRPFVPILGLSAHAMSDDVEKSRQVGCTAYLTKPVKKAVLMDAIRRHATRELHDGA